MRFLDENKNHLNLVLYSSLFFVLTELILLKISSQFFFFLSHYPIALLCIVLRPQEIIKTLLSSVIIFVIIEKFGFLESIQFKNLFFLVFVVFISLSFSLFNQMKKEKKNMDGMIFSKFILTLCVVLVGFIFFYYQKLDHSNIVNILSKLIDSINQNSSKYSNVDIERTSSLIVSILPAINFLVVLTIFMLNYRFAYITVEKLNLKALFSFNLENLNLQKWYTYVYFITVFLGLFNFSAINIYIINILIFLSSGFIVEGYKNLQKYFDKFKISIFLKFLIIFLLFLFLGYVLLLIIFLVGIYANVKRLFYKE